MVQHRSYWVEYGVWNCFLAMVGLDYEYGGLEEDEDPEEGEEEADGGRGGESVTLKSSLRVSGWMLKLFLISTGLSSTYQYTIGNRRWTEPASMGICFCDMARVVNLFDRNRLPDTPMEAQTFFYKLFLQATSKPSKREEIQE
jgi:hypothetical protein